MSTLKKLAATMLVALTAGTMAHAAPMPKESHPMPGTAEPAYLSGGVGKEDAARMRAAAKDYSLQIEFSERRDNQFITDADLKIVDGHGKTVVHKSDAGPITLVRLHPGMYRVTATERGRSETQTATVPEHGLVHVYFHWKGMAKAKSAAAKPVAQHSAQAH